MIDFKFLQEIEELLSKYPEDKAKKTRKNMVKQFLVDLINGKNIDIYIQTVEKLGIRESGFRVCCFC